MRWGVLFLLIVFLTGLVVRGVDIWGRRIIYSEKNALSKYPWQGKMVEWKVAQILVTPLGKGEHFLAPVEKLTTYDNGEYRIEVLPAQETWRYAVGHVLGWEHIDGSEDIYLILDTGRGGEGERYRVVITPSTEFTSNGVEGGTLLAVEEVGWSWWRGRSSITINKYEPSVVGKVGSDKLQELINKEDVVVVTPVFRPPTYAVRDNDGVDVVGWLIMRRIGWRQPHLQ